MRVLAGAGMQIEWTGPRAVRNLAESIGRAEDVRFSPNNRRLAVAGFFRHRIAVFDIDITASATRTHVQLTRGVEISSPALNLPHGVDFLDDETLAVANRGRGVAVFKVPAGSAEAPSYDAAPVQTLPAAPAGLLSVPGSVAVVGGDEGLAEVLICNNAGCDITRHRWDGGAGAFVGSGEVLLGKWFDSPDGVGISHDRRWLAVSDHGSHSVLLHAYGPSLRDDASPDGMLRGVYYPHGVRFSRDDRYVFVADAGSPYVHLYAQEGDGWRGVRHPIAHVRIMDDPLFLRGHAHPQEGGPKGIDIDAGQHVLAVASEHRPLAFFDLPGILHQLEVDADEPSRQEHRAVELGYELHVLERRAELHGKIRRLFALLGYMNHSKSWRITAPLRRLHSALRGSR
ncbi:MAG: hypothetical protein ABUS56_10225 [Acidobacteriota bacterium]